ncbi:MAG: NAD(P)-dependent oxidoreductase [Chlamydiales bacterium]|nr:NAD(P)-dependent oxidoreductase [Chlamydiales bacterium]
MAKEVVIVTGSSGRIGTNVAERLCSQYQVVGFDYVSSALTPASMDYVKVDLESDESVKNGFKHVREKYGDHIVSVIHLAAYYNFTGDPSEKYETITVQGTGRMLRELQNFRCEQFLFSSTMLIHAPCEPGTTINENSPLKGLWDYPKSKIETEALMRRERGNIPIVVLRIAGVYDDYCNSIPLSTQIQRIYEKQFASKVYPGDTSRGTSYLHMDDLVDCIELSFKKRASLPKEFFALVGEDRTMSYDSIQKAIGKLLFGIDWTTVRIPKPIAKIGAWLQNLTGQSYIKPWMVDLADINYVLDISLAKKELGWIPKRYVGDTLPKMIDALRKDPVKWYKHHKLVMPSWVEKKAAP